MKICEYRDTCGKNCSNNRSGKRMNWCEEMKQYLNYVTKTKRKLKLTKIEKL